MDPAAQTPFVRRFAPAARLLTLTCMVVVAALAPMSLGGCGSDDRSDANDAEPPTAAEVVEREDRSWVTEDPEVYQGTYAGEFERFFEGRGVAVSVPVTLTVTAERVTGSWNSVITVPGGRPLRWYTSGGFDAEVRSDGTFEGNGSATNYTRGAVNERDEEPAEVTVTGRLSDDALILGDIEFEQGPLTFQAVRE